MQKRQGSDVERRYGSQVFRLLLCFFFSSSRRHTITKRDWSSDVCSSDLPRRSVATERLGEPTEHEVAVGFEHHVDEIDDHHAARSEERSCRERVNISVGAGASIGEETVVSTREEGRETSDKRPQATSYVS